MKHISLVIPKGDASLSNIEATYKLFTMANKFLEERGERALFEVQLVGISTANSLSSGLFQICPHVAIDDVQQTDLIIVPAVHGNVAQILEANQPLIPWIIKHYHRGTEVASLCIGAFIVANTGLLKGRKCATHWLAADEFRERFPEVDLVHDKILTDENGIYTSGGAYSSLNLNLYLIEKYAGREMAVLSSKVFEIDIERNSQSPFIIFRGQKDHADDQIKKVQSFIEQHYHERITIEQLSGLFCIGRRSLERRFKKATHNTLIEYIQRVKTEAAKKQLENGGKTINEVMYAVGYTDTKAFRDVFKKYTGMTPINYHHKFRAFVS